MAVEHGRKENKMAKTTKAKAIEVTAIEVTVGSKIIRMTVEEAEELFHSLEKLFGSTIRYVDGSCNRRDGKRPHWEYWLNNVYDITDITSKGLSGADEPTMCSSNGVISL
jgi:hypothetical protein